MTCSKRLSNHHVNTEYLLKLNGQRLPINIDLKQIEMSPILREHSPPKNIDKYNLLVPRGQLKLVKFENFTAHNGKKKIKFENFKAHNGKKI